MEAQSVEQIIVVGNKGQGKSTALAGLSRDYKRVIVCDTAGWFAVHGMRSFYEDKAAFARYLLGHPQSFRCALQPTRPVDFGFLCNAVWAAGPCLFVVDEVAFWGSNRTMPPLSRLVQMCRHRGIHLAFATTRPQFFARALTAGATQWLVFRVTGERDLAYLDGEGFSRGELAQIGGLPDDQDGRSGGLKPYHFLHRRDDERAVLSYVNRDGRFRRVVSSGKGARQRSK